MLGVKESNFDREDIALIEASETVEEARKRLLGLLEGSKLGKSKNPMNPRKTAFLRHRAYAVDSVEKVAAIAWNMLLVGEGMGVKNSSYQKNFGSWR
jgi:hypothetical protein